MKSFLFRLCVFLGLLTTLYNIFEIELFAFENWRALDKALNNNADIILFGASGNRFCAAEDTDRRSMAEMLDAELKSQKVVGISHGAYHVGLYYSYLKNLIKREHKPTIVIPIHLRSFTPEWDLRPEYQFTREKNLLEFGIYYPFFSDYEDISKQTYLNTPIIHKDIEIGNVQDFNQVTGDTLYEHQRGFIYYYMQPMNENHRKLQTLKSIVRLAKENNVKILIYIAAVDYERAMTLNIEQFENKFQANISLIKGVLNDYHEFELLDLSKAMPHSYFSYGIRPNEHLNMHGKRKVVKALANLLEKK